MFVAFFDCVFPDHTHLLFLRSFCVGLLFCKALATGGGGGGLNSFYWRHVVSIDSVVVKTQTLFSSH